MEEGGEGQPDGGAFRTSTSSLISSLQVVARHACGHPTLRSLWAAPEVSPATRLNWSGLMLRQFLPPTMFQH